MGGSGGGITFSNSSPAELSRQIRDAELKAATAEFSPQLAERLNSLLANVNTRDAEKTESRLAAAKKALSNEISGSIDLKFGGSVAKHTYVDGLSDVDVLVQIDYPGQKAPTPKIVLNKMASTLQEALSTSIEVSRGSLAITLSYKDKNEIQLVPCVRKGDKLHVPSWNTNAWSKVDAEGFQAALVARNKECGGKLVPTIKLAKAVNGTLPENSRLSGYHIESLAIAAFNAYTGPYSVDAMLPYLFKRSVDLIKAPLRDSSGQSIHVDEYLGKANGPGRLKASHIIDRIARRMENATAARSIELWDSILGEREP